MRKAVRILSVFLCVMLLFSSLFAPVTLATAAQGRITGVGVNLRDKATTEGSNILLSFSKDAVVTLNGTTTGQNVDSSFGTTWYSVTYGDKTGYVYGKYIEEITPPAYDEDFEKNLENFPEDYRAALRTIHNAYPNWKFVADNVNLTLDEAINLEYSSASVYSTKKWVELTYGLEWRDSRVSDGKGGVLSTYIKESRWTYASRQAIAYFMDPRNALVVTNTKSSFPSIFTFLEQSYNSSVQTKDGLRTVVKNTFLEKGYGGDPDAYINDIMQAAIDSNVSPYVIAGTIITEQGSQGTSALISGAYSGYEDYYNFFNYGAYGDNVIKNGLEYAKNKSWNSRRTSIIGGAKLYAEGYINIGQDTFYYMDFNVKGNINHQYATSVYDQCVKAARMREDYTSKVNANATLTFKIPVYKSAPATAYAALTTENYNQDQPTQTVTRKKGDVSGDGAVDGRDLAIIKLYLLGLKKLGATEITAADVSGDAVVNGRDLAIVKLYLLGLKTL